ncbi:14613_t:CDS:2, partial [Funneliformis mosseae]
MKEIDDSEEDRNVNLEVEMKSVKDVRKVAKLLGSRQMREVLTVNTNRSQQIMGPVVEDPEYKLIVQANNLTVDIDNEILLVHM